MVSLLDGLHDTSTITLPNDPFSRIIGQDEAITLVKTAILQRRHVLLCGEPGIGKSLLAKTASTLLGKPRQEIIIVQNESFPERPQVIVKDSTPSILEEDLASENYYVRPEKLPFEVALRMGFRCPRCMCLSTPEISICLECNSPKASDWGNPDAFHGLLHALDVIEEAALRKCIHIENLDGVRFKTTYTRENQGTILVERIPTSVFPVKAQLDDTQHILVAGSTDRFVRISGANPVELLGDVQHDPYGSAEGLGRPPHKRIIPGAIHEAHEGVLYIDELAALGQYQKHLLTAMQDRVYPITAHNPHSSGASVRVDAVPCNFLLFASCNLEDLPKVIPPLRSRIKGYGYEVMLHSWTVKSEETINSLIQFIVQTIQEDGRIPHFSAPAVERTLQYAEEIAKVMDGQRNAVTLRFRELGGLIRIAGDLAVSEGMKLVERKQIEQAFNIHQGVSLSSSTGKLSPSRKPLDAYGDYFF